ncbi:hypothetical protein AQJ91_41310 [Streptomyces dysideae]|uniref:HTH lacI-type domain-containing protein n=1 Tax=Streptomyces dysideae TaxID=909626 RepID=A0A124IDK4_9ACTN|nr:hypothetical protein AQJ91_41310 [Streptomyces dysideae]
MRELDYRPNSAARALKRGEFRTLGVITFSLATMGNVRTLEAIATCAAQEGYAVTPGGCPVPGTLPTHDGMTTTADGRTAPAATARRTNGSGT